MKLDLRKIVFWLTIVAIFVEVAFRIVFPGPLYSDPGFNPHMLVSNELLFVPRPNATGIFGGYPVAISEDGLRDRIYGKTKPPGTLRIASVGDSFAFGFGSALNDTYVKQLERMLPNSEVINFGVSGYNTLQEAAFIKNKVLDYSPDVIVIEFTPNDIEAASIENQTPEYTLSRVREQVAKSSRVISFFKQLAEDRWGFAYRATRDYFDNAYRNETRFSIMAGGIKDIAETARQRNITVIFMLMPMQSDYAHDMVVNEVEADGMEVLDLAPYFEGKDKFQTEITHLYDGHYSPYGNSIVATAIKDKLAELKMGDA